MNEIVIGIIVTLVLLGLGIGLYFILTHKKNSNKPDEKSTWSDDEKTKLKSSIKQNFSGAPTQPTDDEINCTVDKITSNIDFNDFKNAQSQSLPNDQQATDLMYVGKAMSECITFYNWDKFTDDQLTALLTAILIGGDGGAKLTFNARCFANKMKIKYILGEFINGISLAKSFESASKQLPSVLNDFANYVKSSGDGCATDKPTPGGDDTNNLANYLSSIGIPAPVLQKILDKDPNCLVKSLMQLKSNDYFTLKNLFDRKSAPGLPGSAEIAILLVYAKLLSNCLPANMLKWQSLGPDDFIQGFPSVLQSKDMNCIALKFVKEDPYNQYTFLEFVILTGLIEFYSGTVSDFNQMPNILQDFYNKILNPLIDDTSCDIKKY